MKKHLILSGCLCILLCASCQKSENMDNDDLSLSMQAMVEGANLGRTTTTSAGKTSFVAEDAVGFFMPGQQENAVKWSYTGSGWNSETPLYWPNQTESFEFCAFYPYVEEAERTRIPMPDLSTQTGELENLGQFDFLAARCTTNYGAESGVVAFKGESSFKHIYSLIMVTLKKDATDKTMTLKTMKFEGQNIVASHYYCFDSEGTDHMQIADDVVKKDALELVKEVGIQEEGYSTMVLINPSVLETPLNFSITYERDGNSYTATTDKMGTTFESGKIYKYTIRVKKETLEIVGNEITDWVSGGALEDIFVDETPVE